MEGYFPPRPLGLSDVFDKILSLLIAAIEAENVDAVDLLIKNGAKVNMRDNLGKSPLDYAKRCRKKKDKREKMVKMLIEAGAKK